MVTVTQTNSYTDAKIEKSTDSSPSHSQMSRSSSKKSNNSLLVTNGKLEGKTHCRVADMYGYIWHGFLNIYLNGESLDIWSVNTVLIYSCQFLPLIIIFFILFTLYIFAITGTMH